jgi:hypothetical protein
MKLAQIFGRSNLLPRPPHDVETDIGEIIILIFNTLIVVGTAIFVLSAVPTLAGVRDLLPNPDVAGVPASLRSGQAVVNLIFGTLITIAA